MDLVRRDILQRVPVVCFCKLKIKGGGFMLSLMVYGDF